MCKEWIIGICSSENDGIDLHRFKGSVEEVKRKLVDLVEKDMHEDKENWEFGSLDLNLITDQSNGCEHEFYAYGCYSNYHVDYTARELAELSSI